MKSVEMVNTMQEFIAEIKAVKTIQDAKELQHRIDRFYLENDVPKEIDVLEKSGYCEMLAMIIVRG